LSCCNIATENSGFVLEIAGEEDKNVIEKLISAFIFQKETQQRLAQ